MKTLCSDPGRKEILDRIERLGAGATRQWGKMDGAQMLTHCAIAVEQANGDLKRPRALIGRIFGPFVKPILLGEKPFMKNAPTDPAFVVSDARDFGREKARLLAALKKLLALDPARPATITHSFFGPLTGSEWGVLVYKHLDHHLRQFGG
jgi:hypothetical protein